MGRDKALIEADGRPLVVIAADALAAAGAEPIFTVGGEAASLRALGLDVVADDHPGEGPLGGLLTALRHIRAEVVGVLACDLPKADPAAVTAGKAGLGDADVAVALDERKSRQWLHAAWRRDAAVPVLARAFASGERAVHRAAASLRVHEVTLAAPIAVADADTPADLGKVHSGQGGSRPTWAPSA